MSRSLVLQVLICTVLLGGCATGPQPQQATTLPSPTAPGPGGEATLKPGGASTCDPHDFLEQVKNDVPYSEVSLLHNDLMGVRYLNLWVVDPALDVNATGEQASATKGQAAALAAKLTFLAANDHPCVRASFDQVNTTIVDSRYHAWFIGDIGTADIPGGSELSADALAKLTQVFLPSPLLQTPVEHPGQAVPPQGACTWEEARHSLLAYFAPAGPNIDFYFVIDQDGANVWAQWEGPDPQTSSAEFLSGLLVLQKELQCLDPPVDVLWMIYTDTDGVVRLVRTVDGEILRSAPADDLANHLQIIYPAPSP
jgi:hypothetical protein